ncbi:hypothetical protein [Phytohabitans aurantiacus]|uniref:Lipoprotein n=1 Tax=Phytohabitans aurantiacus TaxID=3016789 RepID=A0ABQ5QTN6_9ACTN|nr:hypothetical protein [Phytohabitans aurantiacus]GLH97079.1 hypothetical protein Pa4123_23530 [Phytohabitans aurantiacus]
MKGTQDRRRVVALVALVALGGGTLASMASGLVSCSPSNETVKARQLTAAEAERLGGMRARNYKDARVGLRAVVGKPGSEIRLAGWVDWHRPLVYLAATAPTEGPDDGLLQAVPGLVATRPGRVAEPPAVPPSDNWSVRPFTAASSTPAVIDSFLALLFAIASAEPDAADLLARSEAKWIGRDKIGEHPVDILLGPAVPPRPAPTKTAPTKTAKPKPTPSATKPVGPQSPTPSPGSLAAMGGAVKYWLDGDARLYKFEALLAKDLPVTVELRREDSPDLVAIDAFGGRGGKSRQVTAREAAVLAAMRQRNRKAGGGEITLNVPMLPSGALRAEGWIDWRGAMAYFLAQEGDQGYLMRVNRSGVSVQKAKKDVKKAPVPPAKKGWEFIPWARRGDALGGLDLDMLVNEALAVSSSGRDDAKKLRKVARWLRADTLDGAPVTVYEIPKVADVGGARGQATIRYWVDGSGGLRRLELRTRIGAYGQLDIKPGRVPKLK